MKVIFILISLFFTRAVFAQSNQLETKLFYLDGPKEKQELTKGTYLGDSDICYQGDTQEAANILDDILKNDLDKENAYAINMQNNAGEIVYFYRDLQCEQDGPRGEECRVERQAYPCPKNFLQPPSEKLELLRNLDIGGSVKEKKFFFPDRAQISLKVNPKPVRDDYGNKVRTADFSLSYDGLQYEQCRGHIRITEKEDEMGRDIRSSILVYTQDWQSSDCPYHIQLDLGEFNKDSEKVLLRLTVYETNNAKQKVFEGFVNRK